MRIPRTTPPQTALSREAWLNRYKQRFIAVAGLTEAQAEACARAEPFEILSDGFENEPEDAADEEMSYWDYDDEDDGSESPHQK